MSDVQLERAAIGPHRWIELCAMLERQQHPNDAGVEFRPRTTRIIEDSLGSLVNRKLLIVPGGRYMVSSSRLGVFVWDLGYPSSADCKLIASGGRKDRVYSCKVQATPDGTGLVILCSRPSERCTVYEIYPQSQIPQLTQIAYLTFNPYMFLQDYLLHERVLLYRFHDDGIVFTVWDYRANHSTSFSADVDVKKFGYNLKVIATNREIFVLCEEEILVWAIPPLSPQPPDFFDPNPIHIPSLLGIAFPEGIVNPAEIIEWQTKSDWYCGSSQPIYFDILCRDSKLHRFEIIIKPNILDTSLHIINTEVVPHDFDNVILKPYSICEDTLVACWEDLHLSQFGAYTTGLTSSGFSTTSRGGPAAKMLLPFADGGDNLSLCPSSGRYVHLDNDIRGIVVVDFF